MKVPDVVKIAIRMKAVMATEGPASHSQDEMPRKPGCAMDAGALVLPVRMWRTPRGSANQFGPVMVSLASRAFTAPDAENKNSQTVVMATELVTDGK